MILSVVIVNWNSRELTMKCLESAFKISDTGKIKPEIIVIDNGSTDDSAQKIKEKFPGVFLIENTKNEGYAVAANQGMKISEGKYVLLLGNDTELCENSLLNCVRFLDENPGTGAVGAALLYPDGNIQKGNCKKFPALKNAFFTYLSFNRFNRDYDMADFDYQENKRIDQIATTFLMIRNEILQKISYFGVQYKILYNDVDLCKKIYNCGYNIYFIHNANACHQGSHSTKKADFKIRWIMYTDILKYYTNNFGLSAYLLFPVLLIRFLLVTLFKKYPV
jgi:GT2 family glycosyltransferase